MSRLVVACAVIGLAACKEKSTGALEKFATKFSCPEDQTTVKPRPDLDAMAELGSESTATPSDEVKADPARLAKWTADQAALHDSRAGMYASYDMFEVSGCGHAMILGCHHPTGTKGGSRLDLVSCEESRREQEREKDAKKAAKEEDKAAKRKARDDERAAKRANGP